jgi:hypothetical protein
MAAVHAIQNSSLRKGQKKKQKTEYNLLNAKL